MFYSVIFDTTFYQSWWLGSGGVLEGVCEVKVSGKKVMKNRTFLRTEIVCSSRFLGEFISTLGKFVRGHHKNSTL